MRNSLNKNVLRKIYDRQLAHLIHTLLLFDKRYRLARTEMNDERVAHLNAKKKQKQK